MSNLKNYLFFIWILWSITRIEVTPVQTLHPKYDHFKLKYIDSFESKEECESRTQPAYFIQQGEGYISFKPQGTCYPLQLDLRTIFGNQFSFVINPQDIKRLEDK